MTRQLLAAIGAFLVWNVAVSLAIGLLPAPLALLVALAVAFLFLEVLVLRTSWPREHRRWATLRLRPLRGEPLRWTLIAIPVLAAFSWSVGEVYLRLVPVPARVLNPFDFLIGDWQGRMTLAVLAIGVAPVVEETVFRGLIQRPLERRWGAAAGILIAALIFAAAHLLPWILPLHFLLGVFFGFAVYATRSIWAGIVLHAANNALAVSGLDPTADAQRVATIWEAPPPAFWWVALAGAVISGAATVAVARRMWRAARPGTAG